MKIIVYSTKSYERDYLNDANQGKHELYFLPDMLTLETADKAKGYDGISCFIVDFVKEELMEKLAKLGIKFITLRSAGFDYIDGEAAKKHKVVVSRVPKYAPEAIAEFAVGLILVLNRKITKAYTQGLQHNFTLEGLLGFNLHKKTVGIIGTGNIGEAFSKVMAGFGCNILACDPVVNHSCEKLGVKYVELNELFAKSDIISLHCPNTDQTRNIINGDSFGLMKKGVMLINTARGGLVDTESLIQALESGKVGSAGLDVYTKEPGLFYRDHHDESIKDKEFLKLISFPNVLITPHYAFLTEEAMANIAQVTIDNITAFEMGSPINQVYKA